MRTDGWMDGQPWPSSWVLHNFTNVPKKLKRQYTGARYTVFQVFYMYLAWRWPTWVKTWCCFNKHQTLVVLTVIIYIVFIDRHRIYIRMCTAVFIDHWPLTLKICNFKSKTVQSRFGCRILYYSVGIFEGLWNSAWYTNW